MEFRFFFGPEKKPFWLLDNGVVESGSTIPFHGIISRGLLNSFINNELDHQLWYKYAPFINTNAIPENGLSDEFQTVQKLVAACGFLTFGQSALCVKKYIENYCKTKKAKDAQMDCWNIKEGHTSSVWKVTINSKITTETFAVNVARDREAGIELEKSSRKLKAVGEQTPKINMASVYDIQAIQDTKLPGEVVVTRNEWIDNAYEIHARTNKQTGMEELLMVERFLTSGNDPTHITSVLGRIFSAEEVQKIETGLNNFLTQAATCLPDKPEININDGDIVWNGENAVVVALT